MFAYLAVEPNGNELIFSEPHVELTNIPHVVGFAIAIQLNVEMSHAVP